MFYEIYFIDKFNDDQFLVLVKKITHVNSDVVTSDKTANSIWTHYVHVTCDLMCKKYKRTDAISVELYYVD